MLETLEKVLGLKNPCPGCPFRKCQGETRDAQFRAMLTELVNDGFARPLCRNNLAGTESDDGPMCAGAIAYLIKKGKGTFAMKLGFQHGVANREDWAEAAEDVID